MTKAQANYTENLKCCKFCKHMRCTVEGDPYCSILNKDDNLVELEDTCDSFKNIW